MVAATTYLIDTSSLIGMAERANQRPSLRDLMVRIDRDDAFCISVVALGELYHAVHAATDDETRERRQETLGTASLLAVVPIPLADTPAQAVQWLDTYGQMSATYATQLGIADRWMLTTAVRLHLHLVTEDAPLHDAAAAEQVAATLTTSEPAG